MRPRASIELLDALTRRGVTPWVPTMRELTAAYTAAWEQARARNEAAAAERETSRQAGREPAAART
jgi:hypothetical protein